MEAAGSGGRRQPPVAPGRGEFRQWQAQGVAEADNGAERGARNPARLDLAQRLRREARRPGDVGGIPTAPGLAQQRAQALAGLDLLSRERMTNHAAQGTAGICIPATLSVL